MRIPVHGRHRARLCLATAAFAVGCAATDAERPIETILSARAPGHADIEVIGASYGSVGLVQVTVGAP